MASFKKRANLTMDTIAGSAFDIVQPLVVSSGTDALSRLKEWNFKPKTDQAWQEAAYIFQREVPEIGQALEHTANAVKSCKLNVLYESDEDGMVPVDPDSPGMRAQRALVSSDSDTPDEILYSAAMALQIAGEGYFVGEPVDDDEGNGFYFDVYSMREMTSKGEKWTIATASGERPLPDEAIVGRIHRPDPEFKYRAISPMRRIQKLCTQLLILEQNVTAVAESRLSAQVWYMPESVTLHGLDESQPTAGGPKINPVVKKFLEHASAPINDPSSAARIVPLVMTGPDDGLEKMGVIDVSRAPDAVQAVLREEIITRIARGLDIPVEVIFGSGGLNHWTQWGVSAQFLGDHVEPLGNRIAAFLTRKFLRPMLIAMEDMEPAEAARYRFEFDTAPITSRVDDGPSTRAAYDRGEASAERYRASIGLTEADAPTEEELAKKDVRELLNRASVTYGPRALKFLYPDNAEVQALADEMLAERGNATNEEQSKPEGDPSGDESDNDGGPEDSQDVPDRDTEASMLISRIRGAADRDFKRSIERASSRAVSKARAPRFAMILDTLNKEPDKLVQVSLLSDNELKQLGLNRASLIDSSFADLYADVYGWVFDFLDERDSSKGVMNDGIAAKTAEAFVNDVEVFAVGALAEPVQRNRSGDLLPDSFFDRIRSAIA